jgi:hypothetical protein
MLQEDRVVKTWLGVIAIFGMAFGNASGRADDDRITVELDGGADKAARVQLHAAATEDPDKEPSNSKKLAKKETYLGVVTTPVAKLPTADLLRAQLGDVLPAGQGLAVVRVLADSPAAKARVQPHDILLTFDDQRLVSSDQFKNLIVADKVGREVKLGIIRGGKRIALIASLGEREAPSVAVHSLQLGEKLPALLELRHRPIGSLVKKRGKRVWISEYEKDGHATKISVTETDGKFKVDVAYPDKDGKPQKQTFDGDRKTIDEKLKGLPEKLGDAVRRGLESLEKSENIEHVRPFILHRLESPLSEAVRITLVGKDGDPRILTLDGGGVKDRIVEHLADVDIPESIRKHVETTLRRVELPGKQLEIEVSQ